MWGLSLLVVRPGLQSAGVGSALLRHAHDYAHGARGRIILSSPDPRALRAYARLGLALHPTMWAVGTPRDVPAPDGIREGTRADIPFTEAVDRHVRGAAHGPDIGAQLDMGQTLLIAPGPRLRGLRATASCGCSRPTTTRRRAICCSAVLARVDGTATVGFLTGAQQWAVEVCVEAGLELRTGGALFVGGDVGPLHALPAERGVPIGPRTFEDGTWGPATPTCSNGPSSTWAIGS